MNDDKKEQERSLTELVTTESYQDMSDNEVERLIAFKEQQAYEKGMQAAVLNELRRADEEMLQVQLKAVESSNNVLKALCSQQVYLEKVSFDDAEA